MSALQEAVLAALPGTMQELGARVGIRGQVLWDVVHTLRQAGVIQRRTMPNKDRVFSRVPEPERAPAESPAQEAKEQKKTRKRPVIVFWIDGWPNQDPGRRMVWRIVWGGNPVAERELDGLKKRQGHLAQWEILQLTPAEARRLRAKGYELKEELERRRRELEGDDAPQQS